MSYCFKVNFGLNMHYFYCKIAQTSPCNNSHFFTNSWLRHWLQFLYNLLLFYERFKFHLQCFTIPNVQQRLLWVNCW